MHSPFDLAKLSPHIAKPASKIPSLASRDRNRFQDLLNSSPKEKKKVEQKGKKRDEEAPSIFALAQAQGTMANTSSSDGSIASSVAVVGSSNALALLSQQISDRIDLMTHADKTEVAFELRHPPLFEGMQVTVVEYNHAPKEYNLHLANLQVLSDQARHVLEKSLQELRQQLNTKGIVIQQIQTDLQETLPITPQATQGESHNYQGQGDAQDHERGRQQHEEEAFVFELES